MDELRYIIERYGICSKEVYRVYEVEKENIEGTLISYYSKSLQALIEYIKNNEKNPNEKIWNKIAVDNYYLSSESIGYLYGDGFNRLCKKIRKELKKLCDGQLYDK